MKFKEQFPLIIWILQRSLFYYALGALIVMGSVEFYIWDYMRLKQLQQLHLTSGGTDSYSAIRYYEYLSAIGGADARIYEKLAENYLLIGDKEGAQKAYRRALKCFSPESQEYRSFLETHRNYFSTERQ